MNLDADPPWSKNQLRKLGEALFEKCAPPDGCPDYGAVMLWHNDLAGEVASVISNTRWVNKPAGQFAVTARSKTVDTLVQKLQRSTLKLDRVQDLAGVRIDADLNLTQQTKLAEEIAHHFGDDRVTSKTSASNPTPGIEPYTYGLSCLPDVRKCRSGRSTRVYGQTPTRASQTWLAEESVTTRSTRIRGCSRSWRRCTRCQPKSPTTKQSQTKSTPY
jgi:hypothetical protein